MPFSPAAGGVLDTLMNSLQFALTWGVEFKRRGLSATLTISPLKFVIRTSYIYFRAMKGNDCTAYIFTNFKKQNWVHKFEFILDCP